MNIPSPQILTSVSEGRCDFKVLHVLEPLAEIIYETAVRLIEKTSQTSHD